MPLDIYIKSLDVAILPWHELGEFLWQHVDVGEFRSWGLHHIFLDLLGFLYVFHVPSRMIDPTISLEYHWNIIGIPRYYRIPSITKSAILVGGLWFLGKPNLGENIFQDGQLQLQDQAKTCRDYLT